MNREMNQSEPPIEYILLFRGQQPRTNEDAADYQRLVEKFTAWADRLTERGKLTAGHPLGNERWLISGKDRKRTDGPFAETKEAIAGYFVLRTFDVEEALAIARECPGLEAGIDVEVRRHFQTREEKWLEEQSLTAT